MKGGVLFLLLLVFGTSACSTPRPLSNARRGFFDRPVKEVSLTQPKPSLAIPDERPLPLLRPNGFIWPLHSITVTSPYGKRRGAFHEGVDLKAATGTPVYAAKSGIVLYAGSRIHGYGKLVVMRHRGKVATIYAHNSELLVHRGQKIRQGQQIAVSGETGHTRGPHLHFEIRKGLLSLNPLHYLPKLDAPLAENRTTQRSIKVATSR